MRMEGIICRQLFQILLNSQFIQAVPKLQRSHYEINNVFFGKSLSF